MTKLFTILCIAVCLFGINFNAFAEGPQGPVRIMYIDDQIDPPTADYLEEGIQNAGSRGDQAVLVLINTPGGLMTSMQSIVRTFLNSPVPVIAYIYPQGAKADSAGLIVTIAADIAAMSPGTNTGSATPVQLNPTGDAPKMDKAMERKVISSAAAYARSIADKRGRNRIWIEKAVVKADNITASEALKMNVINYVAKDIPDLMRQIDGREVTLSNNTTVVLHTKNAPLEEYPMGFGDRILHYLANPYIAMFLALIAMYGIIYELASPGAILPGVAGVIAILLLLYSFSVIPVSAAGIAFLLAGAAFFAMEAFVPNIGILAAGGVICMFMGLLMLFRSHEGFMVDIPYIIGAVLVTALFFGFIIRLAIRALRKPYVSSSEGVTGHKGTARTDLNPDGKVFVDGALWSAVSEEGFIGANSEVTIIAMDGLKLKVRKIADSDK